MLCLVEGWYSINYTGSIEEHAEFQRNGTHITLMAGAGSNTSGVGGESPVYCFRNDRLRFRGRIGRDNNHRYNHIFIKKLD